MMHTRYVRLISSEPSEILIIIRACVCVLSVCASLIINIHERLALY